MTTSLPCEIVRDLLPSYADGLVSPVSAQAVEAHLSACPDCTTLLRQMQAPTPEAGPAAIDYLKTLRRRGRRRLTAVVLLCALLLGGALVYFVRRPVPPQVQYDQRSKVVTVLGHGDYSQLVLPEEIVHAYQLRVQDDAFDLTLYLHLFQLAENKAELEANFVRSVSAGLHFLRDYLRQHAPNQIDPERLGHRISLELAWRPVSMLYEYGADGQELSRCTIPSYFHWGASYVLSLLDSTQYSWRQLALAYYTDFLLNPNSMPDEMVELASLDTVYAAAYLAKGGQPGQLTLSDRRALFDAAASLGLQRGLTQWGTAFESLPLSAAFPDAGETPEPMSMLMAVSFFAWLVDSTDYEAAVRYANGADFEACFGQSFAAAWTAWRDSL